MLDTTSPTGVDFNKNVDRFVRLRDKIKELETAHKEQMKPYKDALERLSSMLLDHLNTVGADNVSAEAGTVYRSDKQSASIADQTAFWAWVVAQGDFDFIDVKANVTAVKDYIDQQIEAAKADPSVIPSPPPGVNYSCTHTVGVRRKNASKSK